MKKQIIAFIDELKSNKKLPSFDEAATKQAIVLRLLSFLDWDIFNVEEVYPDYAANSSSVAYALRIRNTNKVFIEVKRVHEKLDKYQKNFVNFATREAINLAILTNGITWWFYLIPAKGSWQQKWFYSIDLLKQKPEAYAHRLIDLLTKNRVARGQALKAAKALFQKKKQKMAADFLPEAWNKIISEPNKIFVELLSENTEKLCGYKIDSKSVENFLGQHIDKWLIKAARSSGVAPPSIAMEPEIMELGDELPPAAPKKQPKNTPPASESYADKSVKAFSFNGQTHTVRAWEDVLIALCNHFAATHPKDFEKVLWISNDQRPYFSRYSDQLRIPEKIKRTDIWVETQLSPDEIVKTAGKLLAEFGYSTADLSFDTR
jgi:hypothetical protein